MLRRVPSSGWIEPSFGDLHISTEGTTATKTTTTTSKHSAKNGASSAAATKEGYPVTMKKESSSASDNLSPLKKRKLTHRNNCSAKLPSKPDNSTTDGSFKRPRKLPRNRPPVPSRREDRCLLDKYEPSNSGELVLHYRKLDELRKWLHKCTTKEQGVSFLLINGPTGCGKTTSIKVLSKEMGFHYREWTNPIHWREYKNRDDFNDYRFSQSEVIRSSAKEEFSSFLLRASRVSSLGIDGIIHEEDNGSGGTIFPAFSGQNVLIMKELPNGFYERPGELEDILVDYYQKTKKIRHCCVVFIVSTNVGRKVGQTWQRIFPEALLQQLHFDMLEFNPVANTLMVKALRRIVEGEQFDLDKSQLERLAETSNGDIRFAINELQLLHSGSAGTSSSSSSSAFTSRDTGLLLFRALGRCIYSKRNRDTVCPWDELLPAHLANRYSRPYELDFDPELTVEQTGFQPSTFGLFLEENVLDFLTSSSDNHGVDNLVVEADLLDVFSQVDMIANISNMEFREKVEKYEMNLYSRAVAFYTCDVSGDKKSFRSMRRPRWTDTWRRIQDLRSKASCVPTIHTINGTTFISEYIPFDQYFGLKYPVPGPSRVTDECCSEDADMNEEENEGNVESEHTSECRLRNTDSDRCHLRDCRNEELDVPIEEFED